MKGISIVVCTHNSSGRIQPALAALFQLEQPAGVAVEIIIVDNASTDGTGVWCSAYAKEEAFAGSFTVVAEARPGLNFARLKGLYTAAYDWILFCDDDNELFRDYLVQAVHILLQQPKAGALGGCGIPRFETAPPGWFERYSHSYAVGPQAAKNGALVERPAELYGAGCFFYKPALLHWFDKGFTTVLTDRKGQQLVSGGDVEWCYLVQLAGYSLVYDSSLRFYHRMPHARLQWDYYLKLKAGITQGTARLTAYHCFFRYTSPLLWQFVGLYVAGLIWASLLWLYFQYKRRLMPSRYSREEIAIGQTVLFQRMKAYCKDAWTALHHFRQIQNFR